MGGSSSVFCEEELQDYEDLTYLTRKEILLAWQRWVELVGCGDNKDTLYPQQTIQQLPELKHNPFRDRITHVFSTGQNNFNEDQVLDADDLGLVVDSLIGQDKEGLLPEERNRLVEEGVREWLLNYPIEVSQLPSHDHHEQNTTHHQTQDHQTPTHQTPAHQTPAHQTPAHQTPAIRPQPIRPQPSDPSPSDSSPSDPSPLDPSPSDSRTGGGHDD
ncbi:hypothetical protein Pmani_004575 [Petrolisthes manimaculis]|uniref:Uncharacterized protein n=1 Tax=Petrolisthes manimaculis TaxID=1843537 RepID=A0AAE1UIE1_9EUCA|nr:hypothetical protein Pmani_004575 [Petrolisthes manimaculis]